MGSEAAQDSLKKPKKASRGTQRVPKPEKRDQKIDPKIIFVLTSFGAILGAILGPELAPKGDQKLDHFWNP